MRHLIFFLFLFCFSSSYSQNVSPAQAKDYVGKKTTVCGEVFGSYHSTKTKGQPTFLDMGGKYPASTFTILIWGDDLSKFSYDIKSLEGKNICVTGVIKEYKGKPEVIVYGPDQIKTE